MNAVFEAPALAVAAPSRSIDELVAELLYLSPDKKLEIITRLAQSLQGASAATVAAAAPASLLDFIGAWADMPGTDAEIMADIRSARTFTRPEISLD